MRHDGDYAARDCSCELVDDDASGDVQCLDLNVAVVQVGRSTAVKLASSNIIH